MTKDKKNKDKTEDVKEEVQFDINNQINEEFGSEIICSANSILDNPRQIIPLTPKLDLALGGGIADGSIVVLAGAPKCGKTTLSLNFLANCQKKDYGSRKCYIANVEGRIKERDLRGINGLDTDKLSIIESKAGKILKAHEYLATVEKIINTVQNSVILIDSFSALCTEAEMIGGMDEMQRADGPKLLAKFFRKVSNVVPVNRNILIGITHLMANPTGYGSPIKDKGGYALTYQLDYKLMAKTVTPTKTTEGVQIGQEVEWQIACSGLGPPGGVTTSYIKYGIGIDILRELIDLACDIGAIKKGGAWYEIKFGSLNGQKFQGVDSLYNALKDNKKEIDMLEKEIRKTLGFTHVL